MDKTEILEKITDIVHESMPETKGETFTESTVINRDAGIDSMNFILIICKIEAEFHIHIEDKKWMKLSTMGEIADTVQGLVHP